MGFLIPEIASSQDNRAIYKWEAPTACPKGRPAGGERIRVTVAGTRRRRGEGPSLRTRRFLAGGAGLRGRAVRVTGGSRPGTSICLRRRHFPSAPGTLHPRPRAPPPAPRSPPAQPPRGMVRALGPAPGPGIVLEAPGGDRNEGGTGGRRQ